MPATTIISILTDEHREVSKLFAQLEKTTTRAARKRKELFSKLDRSLSVHAEFEEANVYPLLEGSSASAKALALEAVEEHLQIKRLLAEMRTLDPQDDVWSAKLTVLGENVRHHVKEEEGEALPKLRETASDEDLERLADLYEEVKSRASGPDGEAAGDAGEAANGPADGRTRDGAGLPGAGG